jgi:molecular chaperone GrpE
MNDKQAVDTPRIRTDDRAAAEAADAELEPAKLTDGASVAGDDGEPSDLESGGGAVAAELTLLAEQRDEYLALAQRTQADFENYRKRVARDAAAAELRGVGRLARELLPALDNLERALGAASQGTDEQLVEGLRLVQRELGGALERVGIESFGAAGERFDPGVHEAVAQQPRDGVEPGEVTEVFQAGYRLGGATILRPARVMVAG